MPGEEVMNDGERGGAGPLDGEVELSNTDFAVECLNALIEVSVSLSPDEMKVVQQTHPFATPTWLERVAYGSVHGSASGVPRSTSQLISAAQEVNPYIAARARLTGDASKLLLVMVGLPARGKSMICHRLVSFLSFLGVRTRAFSAGNKRREAWELNMSDASPETRRRAGSSMASFFSSDMLYARMTREKIAMEIFQESMTWLLEAGGEVAVFDATNSTKERRRKLTEQAAERDVKVVFIEALCDNPQLLAANMRHKVQTSPDFLGMEEKQALDDLRMRIEHYERSYETLADDEGAYIQLFDLR